MQIDLELYRKEIRLPTNPPIQLSVIDISSEQPQFTFVFLHGFGGKATQWQYQLRHFYPNNRVIAIDLRGHGRSDKPSGKYTMAEIQADLELALDILGVHDQIYLIGHSFGGAVACEFANSHPERLSGLVIIAAAGEFQLNPLYRFALRLPVAVLNLAKPFVRVQLGSPPHVLQSWYLNNLSQWKGWDLFRGLHVPTLVIRGHLDIVIHRSLYENVARSIPDAEEVDVGASGHMVMLERRDAVNRAIERFAQRITSETRTDIPEGKKDLRVLDFNRRETRTRASLKRSRPWLNHYEEGVPHTIAVPDVPITHLLRSSARRFPLHPALFFEGRRLTYYRLEIDSNRFANALRALGIQKGDRVMIFLPNLPQFVIAYLGILKAGAVAVFTLPTTEQNELMRQVSDSGARLLVTLVQFGELARRAMHAARSALKSDDLFSEGGIEPSFHIILTEPWDYIPPLKRLVVSATRRKQQQTISNEPHAAQEYSFRSLINTYSRDNPNIAISPSSLAVIIYTGGTIADPKGVMLSHLNLVANALQTRHWMPQARDGHERFLCVLPFSHSYGLTTALNVPISMGASLIIKPKFEVGEILRTIHRLRPTIFPGVPRMYVAINDYPGVRRFGISSIQACISGSAPLPIEVQEAFEKLTRGKLVEGYGLTEASPVTHANPLHGLRKIGSIGVPLPSTEAKIVDLIHGHAEVHLGQIGELAVRGPQVMMGYWQNPEATRKAINNDSWLLTGDIAQMDEEGFFRIIARKSDMWYASKRGKPAFPRDVEEVLYEVPQVKETAVIAIAGQPIAFVITRKERPSAEALIAYCRRRLHPSLVPRMVIFLDDFPRSFIGKVLRRELARHFEESQRDTSSP